MISCIIECMEKVHTSHTNFQIRATKSTYLFTYLNKVFYCIHHAVIELTLAEFLSKA